MFFFVNIPQSITTTRAETGSWLCVAGAKPWAGGQGGGEDGVAEVEDTEGAEERVEGAGEGEGGPQDPRRLLLVSHYLPRGWGRVDRSTKYMRKERGVLAARRQGGEANL